MDVTAFIDHALREDLGSGDYTSLACIPADASGKAQLIIKEKTGVLAGVELAQQIFARVDSTLQMEVIITDGALVKAGDIVLEVKGAEQSILKAERLVLNCMQRMSGIATVTRAYVDKVAGLPVRILDTRKTIPGLRELDKWAVRIGGGTNHRMGLHDRIMIKDNHIDFCGGIAQAVQAVRKYLKEHELDLPVEVEARDLEEVKLVLAAEGIDRVLLDNFTPEQTRAAVNLVDGRIETEASGGITLSTVRAYAEAGVDYISVGALTHSVEALDMSLKAV